MALTSEVTLALRPEQRFELIDVNAHIREEHGDVLSPYAHALYCSYHTTAGYLDQHLCRRLNYNADSIHAYLKPFQELFPPNADYQHDRLELRQELSEEQRRNEPRNADSHLTFIGSGLENCVTYANRPEQPVYFIDLDGVNPEADQGLQHRSRLTTVIGYNEEVPVSRIRLPIPVSTHRVDSINLKNPDIGLFEQLNELSERYGVCRGRIDIQLDPNETHAGLTVNEDETLLMKHDLRHVLRNPMRFMAQKGLYMLRNPLAIPGKAKDYAKYDLVQIVNKALDKMGLSESVVERVVEKFLAVPAERFLRMKRSVSLLVNEDKGDEQSAIVQGRYQSPLLVQWQKPETSRRFIEVTLYRFE